MAVAPTGDIFKALSFDNVSSRTYGVYITGEAVYNAPERDVEMVEIPGRNGSFALDKGRFQNIEVSYPAGIFADNEANFADAISEFRNFLCSRNGYVRLQDEYNPNEYRMAVYKSGLEVSPAQLKAGEFEITFDCKPQRFLTSGETAVTVANGGTMTNPTLFETRPLLETSGSGDIVINDEVISIQNTAIGTIVLTQRKEEESNSLIMTSTVTWDSGKYEAGDKIYPDWSSPYYADGRIEPKAGYAGYGGYFTMNTIGNSGLYFIAGTPYHTVGTVSSNEETVYSPGGTAVGKIQWLRTITTDYDGANTLSITIEVSITGTAASYEELKWQSIRMMPLFVDSTKPVLDGTIYIDLDIGEAWIDDDGIIMTANNAISIPAKLPSLAPGVNTISYSDTLDYLKATPRWWKI